MYAVLQVFVLFVQVTRKTVDVTTLYINSLMSICAKPVLNTLVHDFTYY